MLKVCLWGLGRNGGDVKRKTYFQGYLSPKNAFSSRAELEVTRERLDGGKQRKHTFHSWTSTSHSQKPLRTESLKKYFCFEHTN